MSDPAARIKDLTERIAIIKGEFEDRPLGAMRSERRRAFKDDLTDMFFDDDQRQRERIEELERELEAAEAEMAQQVAATPRPSLTIDNVADFDSPVVQAPPVVPGPAPRTDQLLPLDGPWFKRHPRSPAVVIGAAGLVATVLAIGVWQAVASSPQTAGVATFAPVPTTTSRPAATAAAAVPSAATATIRVTGQPAAYSGACNSYSVTFSWIIEGTQSGTFMMRTGKGDAYGPESGPFTLSGSNRNFSWDPASGRLMVLGATDSGPSPGFRSQITKVNGRAVEGDATSIAAPGHCS